MLNFVLQEFARCRLGADGENYAFIVDRSHGPRNIPNKRGGARHYDHARTVGLTDYPAADRGPETANNFPYGVKFSIMIKMSPIARV